MSCLVNTTVLTLLMAVSTAFAQSYICAVDAATGFSYDKVLRQWSSVNFKAVSKYVISRTKDQSSAWKVTETGESIPTTFCKQDFDRDGELRCIGLEEVFLFNRKSMRFMTTNTMGYWNEGSLQNVFPNRNEGSLTPAISIGRCTLL